MFRYLRFRTLKLTIVRIRGSITSSPIESRFYKWDWDVFIAARTWAYLSFLTVYKKNWKKDTHRFKQLIVKEAWNTSSSSFYQIQFLQNIVMLKSKQLRVSVFIGNELAQKILFHKSNRSELTGTVLYWFIPCHYGLKVQAIVITTYAETFAASKSLAWAYTDCDFSRIQEFNHQQSATVVFHFLLLLVNDWASILYIFHLLIFTEMLFFWFSTSHRPVICLFIFSMMKKWSNRSIVLNI